MRKKEAREEMGKHGKKHRESNHRASRRVPQDNDGDYSALPSSAFDLPPPPQDDNEEEEEEGDHDDEAKHGSGVASPSKFHLYQLSVQVASISILFFCIEVLTDKLSAEFL